MSIKRIHKSFEDLSVHELYDILRLRSKVFVVEQKCIYEDIDGVDLYSEHFFLVDERNNICAYLRIFPQKDVLGVLQIGRVVTALRGQGLGNILMQEAVEAAKSRPDIHKIVLEAQTYAAGFYEKNGFSIASQPFLEDGIPHVLMEMEWQRATDVREL